MFLWYDKKHTCEFTSSIFPSKHQKQVQAINKSGETTKLADTTRVKRFRS